MTAILLTKEDFVKIVRKAMSDAGVTDQGDAFVHAIAEMMCEVQRSLESKED